WEFDQQVKNYSLGEYQELQTVIDHFHGSYSRLSLAASFGYTAATVQTPLFADHTVCEADESPLACEYRIHNPAFALITLGTNDAVKPESFEPNMRKLIEFTLQQGIIPVLSTKADNLERDHANNATLARLAAEYELPLWNFWLAVQPLPRHGLQDDSVHLTFAGPRFDDPWAMQQAWAVRNLTALQVLDVLLKETGAAGAG
ncbi:MAG: SGNH/GDSL hydrolase family protein, partial [Anaerolineae bacterium]|nr:SGNH/GDSL hydrolase family protein [Anaerolineae bacterium]